MKLVKRLLSNGPTQPAEFHAQQLITRPHKTWSISLYAGSEQLTMHWEGDDEDQVAREFAAWLYDDDENAEEGLPPYCRTVQYHHQGREGLTVFRADWVAGFNVVK